MKEKQLKQNSKTLGADTFSIPQQEQKKQKKAYSIDPNNAVDIIAFDAENGSFRYMGMFEAERWKDPDSNSVYLKNELYNFMVSMPETEDFITNLTVGNISEKLVDIEKQIKREKKDYNKNQTDNNKEKHVNQKDLIDKYVGLKNKLRASLFSSTSTFWGGNKGKPLLLIQRRGGHWFPLKYDSDTSTIHTVSNARNTITRNAESNKRTKYGALNNLTTLGLIFIVCTFLMFSGGIWSWYKAYEAQSIYNEKLDQTELGALIKECRINIDQEKIAIQEGVIAGVSESLIQNQKQNEPVGSGR